MVKPPSRLGFDPSAIRIGIGPYPDAVQARLLTACLGAAGSSEQAWNAWLSQTDFDHEHGASHELAALAVQRLGAAAGSASIANRSRGLARRAWSLSVLAFDAAGQIGAFCRRQALHAVAIAHLATHGGGAVDLLLPMGDLRLLASWLEGGLSGAAVPSRTLGPWDSGAFGGARGDELASASVGTSPLDRGNHCLVPIGGGSPGPGEGHGRPQPTAVYDHRPG
jgi:hypothetical protein